MSSHTSTTEGTVDSAFSRCSQETLAAENVLRGRSPHGHFEHLGQRSSDSYFQKQSREQRYGYQGGKESWGNWEVRTCLYTLLMLCIQ